MNKCQMYLNAIKRFTMKEDKRKISVRAARLIIGYLHNSLTEAEKDELDEWLLASEENEDLFCELTEGENDTLFSPDQLIAETEQVLELWMITALIVREKQGLNNKVERKYLREWANVDCQNQRLYKELQNPAYMQKMLVWNRLKREELNLF